MNERNHPGLYVEADPDPNTVYSTGAYVQQVTDTGRLLFVNDPAFGIFTVGGDETEYQKIMYDLVSTPAMQRAEGVSQLCKDEGSATIPNTAFFTRLNGMVGIIKVVDDFARQSNMNDTERLAAQLEASFDDSAHKIFSHAIELMLQAWGGNENKHQGDWPEYARFGGILDVLDKHSVKVNQDIKLEGVKLPPWVNAKSPDLDVDRVQYTVFELQEWFDHDSAPPETRELIGRLCDLNNLTLDETGNFAFKDIETARLFAKGYLLLSTEHWNDPVNRVQLYMLTQAARRLVVQRNFKWMNSIDKGMTRRPEDYFNGIDDDMISALHENHGHTDPTLFAIHNALYPIASAERKRFIRYKMSEYAQYLRDEKARDYPSEYLSPPRVQFGLPHPSVTVELSQSTAEERAKNQKMPMPIYNNGHLEYELMPLKNRFVDPRVMLRNGSTKRLSQLDQNYCELLNQHQNLQSMKAKVELVFADKFIDGFTKGIKANESDFDALAVSPDFTHDQKRRIIEQAAERARANAIKLGRLVLV